MVNTWKVILATLVIFGAGVLTGGLITKRSLHVHPSAAPQPSAAQARPGTANQSTNRAYSGPGIPGIRKDFVKSLDREVGLTVEQRERIEKILADGQDCTKRLWDQIAPQMHGEWKCVKENIRAQLTDEQKPRFDQFMKRQRKPDDRKQDDRKQEERKAQPSNDVLSPKDAPQSLPVGN